MNLRTIGTSFLGTTTVLGYSSPNVAAKARKSAESDSASRVPAEVVNGSLNPAESKPGDTVTVRLKQDLTANGQVVLKKESTITGVVRNVKRQSPSMMQLEWSTPLVEGKVGYELSIAVQSVTQVNSSLKQEQARSNWATLNMPSGVAIDYRSGSSIDSSLESLSDGSLYKVGWGQLVSASGSRQSLDLFSHLSNDTVITSPSRDFEISSGAQMQLLVGVHKR